MSKIILSMNRRWCSSNRYGWTNRTTRAQGALGQPPAPPMAYRRASGRCATVRRHGSWSAGKAKETSIGRPALYTVLLTLGLGVRLVSLVCARMIHDQSPLLRLVHAVSTDTAWDRRALRSASA